MTSLNLMKVLSIAKRSHIQNVRVWEDTIQSITFLMKYARLQKNKKHVIEVDNIFMQYYKNKNPQ